MQGFCGSWICLALVLFAACEGFSKRQLGTPDGAARYFLRSVKAHNCDAVWDLFSAATQKQIEAQTLALKAHSPPDAPMAWAEPKRLYCGAMTEYASYDPKTVELSSQYPEMAVVAVKIRRGKDFLVPGFWPTKFEYIDRTMTLVREGGVWKVDHIRGPAPRGPGSDLIGPHRR